MVRIRLLLAAAVVLAAAAPSHAAAPADVKLVNTLRKGGLVLYFRHAATDWKQADEEPIDLTHCSAQRNLSAKGRAEARAIGYAFRRLSIPVAEVLSSPFCRARDTARIAFGEFRVDTGLTGVSSATAAVRAKRRAELRRLLATRPRNGRNVVLIAHLSNIREAADVTLDEGEAAVFAPEGKSFRLVTKISFKEWSRLVALRHTSSAAPR